MCTTPGRGVCFKTMLGRLAALTRAQPSFMLVPGAQCCVISALCQQSLGKVETLVKLRELR